MFANKRGRKQTNDSLAEIFLDTGALSAAFVTLRTCGTRPAHAELANARFDCGEPAERSNVFLYHLPCATTAHQHHHAAADGGAAEVGLLHEQRGHHAEDENRSAPRDAEAVQLGLTSGQKLGEEDDPGQLHQLAGLHPERAKADPARGALG